MATKNFLQSSVKLQFINITLSYFTVLLCSCNFFYLNGLLNIGKLNSPTLLIIIVNELIRWFINKFVFNLDANSKECVLTGNVRVNPKKSSCLKNIKNACKLSGLLSTFTVFYALVCILLGASYQNRYEETLILSALLTSFTILPICLFLGPTKTLQYLFYDTFELNSRIEVSHLELLQYNALGTLIGAWSGSVVAPLDWDREWQAYPIPNMVGGLIGFTISNTHTMLSLLADWTKRSMDRGKKIM